MPLPAAPLDLPEGKLPSKMKKKGGLPSSLVNIEEGNVKKNINDAPTTPRPPPPNSQIAPSFDAIEIAREWGEKKRLARIDSNWQTIADVDWEDLEHFVARARFLKESAEFDTCIRILEALRKQILNK